MKNFIVLLIFISLSFVSFGQPYTGRHEGRKHFEKIEQLERLKLLEVLNLDEETSVRFFSRRNDFKEAHRKLLDQRDSLMHEIEEAIEDNDENYDYKSKRNEVMVIEDKLIEQRKNFLNSLTDILTEEQIAKVIVFEAKFMREIRESLMRGKRGHD